METDFRAGLRSIATALQLVAHSDRPRGGGEDQVVPQLPKRPQRYEGRHRSTEAVMDVAES